MDAWSHRLAGRVVLTALVALAGGVLPSALSAQPKTLAGGANFVIKSLDPGRTVETTGNMINHSTYDSLVTFDVEDLSTPKPSLATEWKISPDGKTYTFKLRPSVRFARGNPLTSADVRQSFERVKNLKSNPAFFLDLRRHLAGQPLLNLFARARGY